MTQPVTVHDSAPPVGPSPQRPRRKKGKTCIYMQKEKEKEIRKVQKKFERKLEGILQISLGTEERERKKEKNSGV